MKYMIEPIGDAFSKKAISSLADRFTSRATEGYELHSIFHVVQPGCLFFGKPTTTYLAVYVTRTSAPGGIGTGEQALLKNEVQGTQSMRIEGQTASKTATSTASEAASRKANVCPDCNAAISADDKFCGNCGRTVR